jgi:hypothetical protein
MQGSNHVLGKPTQLISQILDLSRFGAAPFTAYYATKDMNYGADTGVRSPEGYRAYCADPQAC